MYLFVCSRCSRSPVVAVMRLQGDSPPADKHQRRSGFALAAQWRVERDQLADSV